MRSRGGVTRRNQTIECRDHLGRHGLRHRGFGHLAQPPSLAIEALDQMHQGFGFRLEQQTVLTVANAFGEAANAGCNRDHAQGAHFTERIVPGLGNRGKEQRRVGSELFDQLRELFMTIVDDQINPGFAEQSESFTPATQRDNMSMTAQSGQSLPEQIQPLAAAQPTRDQQSQKPRRWRAYLAWLGKRAKRMRDPRDLQIMIRTELAPSLDDMLAGRDQCNIAGLHAFAPAGAKRGPESEVSRPHAHGPTVFGQRAFEVDTTIVFEIAKRIEIQQRPQRIEIVQYLYGRQTGCKTIQAVADQRRDHDAADTKSLDGLFQDGSVVGMFGHRADNCRRQRVFANQPGLRPAQKQFQAPAAMVTRSITSSDQHQMSAVGIACNEIVDPAPHAATPVMRNMQGDGLATWLRGRNPVRARQGQVSQPQPKLTGGHRMILPVCRFRNRRPTRVQHECIIDQKCTCITIQFAKCRPGRKQKAIRRDLLQRLPDAVTAPVDQTRRLIDRDCRGPGGKWIQSVVMVAGKHQSRRTSAVGTDSLQHRHRRRRRKTGAQQQHAVAGVQTAGRRHRAVEIAAMPTQTAQGRSAPLADRIHRPRALRDQPAQPLLKLAVTRSG